MASTYRMKPIVTVEAMRVDAPDRVSADVIREDGNPAAPPGNMVEVAEWAGASITVGHDREYEVAVPNGRHGAVYARDGEWVVSLGGGEYRIVDDATFQRLYVKVGGP